jgi:hypothetical protein
MGIGRGWTSTVISSALVDVLEGSASVRLIYVDEAETSANEPVTIVVGIIVRADLQWAAAALGIKQTIDRFVPVELRQNR